MDYHKTQIGRMLEQVKKAMLAHVPIVYIPTRQKEVVNEMFFGKNYSGSIIPRTCYSNELKSTIVLEYNIYFDNDNAISDNYKFSKYAGIKSLESPTLFVSFVDDFKDASCLKSFISDYYNIKGVNYIPSDKLNIIWRSLYIVVTPTEQKIPESIAPYVRTVKVKAISDEEIEELIYSKLDEYMIPRTVITNKELLFNQMRVSFRGFSALHIKQLMDQMIGSQNIDFDEVTESEVLSAINESKQQMLSNTSGLRWEKTEAAEAAGLDGVTGWLNRHSILFKDPKHAKEQHVDIPGAALLTGIPGSGKSLMAKTTARKLEMPLISLDMGALRDKYQGESEHNMVAALQTAEQMAPCVLWVDEIEKVFGSSDNGGDDGLGQRLFGKFLTWMQEKSSACFVFATSNDVTKLPPELFRSERFDKKFFTFMPTARECASIFIGNIKKQNDDYQKELLRYNKQERKNMPGELFATSLLDEFVWMNILNECCSKNPEECSLVKQKIENKEYSTYRWKEKRRPTNKLLTGADISSIIKEVKFKVNPNLQPANGSVVYEHTSIVNAVKEIIQEFRPYGETNLVDIAKCFLLLFKNQFESASGNCILDFKQFDEDELIYTPCKYIGNQEEDDKSKYINKNIMCRYDSVLYDTIVGAINYYLPKMKEK